MSIVKEFWNDFEKMLLNKDGKYHEIFIPRDIFSIINNINGISGSHKAFVFSAYCLIKFANNFRNLWLRNPDIKELWGYRRDNKDLDKILKKGGIMDDIGLTVTLVEGVDTLERELMGIRSTKVHHKNVVYDEKKCDIGFFTISTSVLAECMKNNKTLGTIGLYIYSFICCSHNIQGRSNHASFAKLATGYISEGEGTGLSLREQ